MTQQERAQLEFAAKTNAALRKLLDEHDRIHPVYEAAKAWRDTWRHRRPFGTEETALSLVDVVDTAIAKESTNG